MRSPPRRTLAPLWSFCESWQTWACARIMNSKFPTVDHLLEPRVYILHVVGEWNGLRWAKAKVNSSKHTKHERGMAHTQSEKSRLLQSIIMDCLASRNRRTSPRAVSTARRATPIGTLHMLGTFHLSWWFTVIHGVMPCHAKVLNSTSTACHNVSKQTQRPRYGRYHGYYWYQPASEGHVGWYCRSATEPKMLAAITQIIFSGHKTNMGWHRNAKPTKMFRNQKNTQWQPRLAVANRPPSWHTTTKLRRQPPQFLTKWRQEMKTVQLAGNWGICRRRSVQNYPSTMNTNKHGHKERKLGMASNPGISHTGLLLLPIPASSELSPSTNFQ